LTTIDSAFALSLNFRPFAQSIAAMSELNDPRLLFAAERTLLAWNRTCLALMAFGFMIERFGLFLRILIPNSQAAVPGQSASVWIGLAFIVFGGILSVLSTLQHWRVLKHLEPHAALKGYWHWLPVLSNLTLTLMSILLSAYMLYSVFGG